MAGGLQYVKTSNFFPYTPTVTSAAAAFPASALGDVTGTHPVARTWHSTTTAEQTITCPFGSAKNGTWVALLNANFTQVKIGVSTDGTNFTDIVTGNATLLTRTISQDHTDPEGYYKLLMLQAFTAKTHGRIVIPSQATTDGNVFFKLGALFWGNALVAMTHNFHVPLGIEYVDPEYAVEGKDWREAGPAGIRYANLSFRNTAKNPAEMAEWHTLRRLPSGSRVLWHYNLDDFSQVYLMERNKPATITRHGVHQEIDTGLRSVA